MLAAMFGLAFLVAGCGQDNEKAAKIEGVVPAPDGLTPQESKAKARGFSKEDMTKAGYNPSSGGGGNNRRAASK